MRVLKKARLLAGKTIKETAHHLGVSPMTVWNWEKGKVRVPLLKLRELEKFYMKHDLIYELVDELEEEAKNENKR